MLMLKGADVILTPNACELDDTEAGLSNSRVAQFRTRAFANAVGVAMANYPAPQLDGRSVAFDVNGAAQVEAGPEGGVFIAEFDLTQICNGAELNDQISGAGLKHMARSRSGSDRPSGAKSGRYNCGGPGHATLLPASKRGGSPKREQDSSASHSTRTGETTTVSYRSIAISRTPVWQT
jgi:hypothetical protein